ncbi:MAG: fibronectin type III domain-containing protein [Deltaproteobacteria bacterium]|jgi:predicted CxxxxCH...CXXCH cytochrome family protein|nr:fibronectin type III domain-containing protein [Deltaproteobacteria bacterium]
MLLGKSKGDLGKSIYFLYIMITFVALIISILLFANHSHAADTTENTAARVYYGPATLAGTPEVTVKTFYSDDDNNNNSILIEWGESGVDFALGSHTSPIHPANPYQYSITPLDNTKVYQFRVTFQDADNGSNPVQIITGKRPYNPMLHNAVSTGSGTSKWASGWGIGDAGAQYGEFSCQTCHDRDDPANNNIKRIRRDWSEASLPDVPVKLDGETIDFQTDVDGTAEYALDDSTDHSTSNRICEACHTQTDHHRHDDGATPGSTDHKSSNDCRSCHLHQSAFAPPGCAQCHGGGDTSGTELNYWPDSADQTVDTSGTEESDNDSGEHLIHMTRLAAQTYSETITELLSDTGNGLSKDKQITLCAYCHPNPGTDLNHALGDDVGDIGTFLNMAGSTDGNTAGTYNAGSCSAVDCHNGIGTASPGWYDGATASCTMCHTVDGSNPEAVVDPTTGLHYHPSPGTVEVHDDDFHASAGTCTSCHQVTPSSGHFNGVGDTPDVAMFNFQSSASIDVKLNVLTDTSDDTCAADCHSDNGNWYRYWSVNAFDSTPFDVASAIPPRCDVCHGIYTKWAEGTSHWLMEQANGSSGGTHNSQNPTLNPGAACADCHVYPERADLHENSLITLNDDQTAPDDYTPKDDQEGAETGIYCAPCHELSAAPQDGKPAYTFPYSNAFPGYGSVEVVEGATNPEYSCFSGQSGCHGDTANNWWPNVESTDPANYPNRAGAHYEHGTTIGELLAALRGRPDENPVDGKPDVWQEDRNDTCNYCHPMVFSEERQVWESKHHRQATNATVGTIVDVFGGYVFPGADESGIVSSGDPSIDPWTDADPTETGGFLYQLEDQPKNPGLVYPVDTDAQYWQYLDGSKDVNTVRHGVCSQVSCHSNSPYTPQWYGDHQAPGSVSALQAFTDDQSADHDLTVFDTPGTVHLYWQAPGDNGDFSGTAYEYEVYFREQARGIISEDNLPGGISDDGYTVRAGNPPSPYRQGDSQEMVVDGLNPGTSYYFAVRAIDEPEFDDTDSDGIYETLVRASNLGQLSVYGTPVPAHADNVAPIFYGLNKIYPHDEERIVNLHWDAAKDHTMPITYWVWYTNYSLKTHLANGGDLTQDVELCYMEADPTTPVTKDGNEDYCIEGTSTEAINYQVVVPTQGDLYSFLVRAYDGVGNHDDNTTVQMVLPQTAPMEPVDTQLYLLTEGSPEVLVHQADVANPVWPGAGTNATLDNNTVTELIWLTDMNLPDGIADRDCMVSGVSFDIQFNSGTRNPIEVTAELGYWDSSGGSFVQLGNVPDVTVREAGLNVSRRVTKLQKFPLSNYKGVVPAGEKLAIRMKRWDPSVGTSITFNFGDETTKGQFLVNVQPYNHAPNASFQILLNTPTVRPGGYIDVDWVAAGANDPGQSTHYDIFGSADNGNDGYPYVIATDVTDADDFNGSEFGKVTWDTVGDGLTASHQCKVKIEVGDGYQYEDPSSPNYPDPLELLGPTYWLSHSAFETTTIPVDNTTDVEPPAQVSITSAETRPKQGSVFLEWTAVGDDGLNHGTRVTKYDIRFRPDPAGNGVLSDANWGDANTFEAHGEPVPNFSGSLEQFELLDLAPEQTYDIGIKACDEADNCSTLGLLSTTEGWRVSEGLSEAVKGGPFYCGICHATPPDEPDTKGTHREHGYTLKDCAKCHGDGNGVANDVTTYDGRHYNGYIDIGWAKNSDGTHAPLVQLAIESGGSGVTVTQTNDGGPVTIYQDPDGAGGYNAQTTYNPSFPLQNTDSGTCLNFGPANANGCHGPFDPKWASDTVANKVQPECADCHGDKSVARDYDPYTRIWDDNVGGLPSDNVKASPPIDNHGQSLTTDKYVGAHLVHLNASFRFAKGDSCRLCHLDTMYSGEHADGKVDVRFDPSADKSSTEPADRIFNGPEATTGMSCGDLSSDSCHDTGVDPLTWPTWNVPGAQCDSCHGMSEMGTIPHISDNGAQACDYCHVQGHPQSPDGISPGDPAALLVNNNPAVGINYKSGGIHIRKVIGGRTTLNSGEPIDTLAEICWGCHENQTPLISEWGTDDAPYNYVTGPYYDDSDGLSAADGSVYDFGDLPTQTSWAGAEWNSAKPEFGYKAGIIQSVHSTDPTGVATVSWDAANGRYNEVADDVSKIRCTNCHDVHDLNKADNDTVSGAPYLRGTWKSNPYEEDGAPWSKTYSLPPEAGTVDDFGPVPRAGIYYDELGGYYIDQNNVIPGTTTRAPYPTSGWTLENSAGLCLYCHENVDDMDKVDDGNLWLGTNGHSNSAIGGKGSNKANIFDFSHGRPTPNNPAGTLGNEDRANIVADMAMQSRVGPLLDANEDYMYGYRSAKGGSSNYLDPLIATNYAYNQYDWGAQSNASTIDTMYHQFSCSKCHNPHASRLPKLMITNCLDIRHNTWDDAQSDPQNSFTHASNDPVDRGMPAAYYASAQNCHRFDPARGDTDNDNIYDNTALRGGWNKVTPWVKSNLDDSEHKGSLDPAYGTTNATSPWRHSDFPTESSGW